jgi:hypothetical protein
MTKIVNILEIDSKLRKYYEDEALLIPEYRQRLATLERFADASKELDLRPALVNAMRSDCQVLLKRIRAVKDFEFYYFDTKFTIAEFENMMKTPVANSFFTREGDAEFENRKRALAQEFFQKMRFYAPEFLDSSTEFKKSEPSPGCDAKFLVTDDCTATCVSCCQERARIVNNSSFVDNSRVNISSKYTYDRKIHFRDCINQYQGKQNTHIPPDVFKNLETALINHRVISSERSADRFDRVTVSHIHMFLKSLNYTKYYDDAILIHSVITGSQPDNIEHLEDDLMKDFDAMLTEYDKNFKTADRKNFINTQYVLYQLLKRHKHKCDKDHFVVMRTMSDRKSYHDRICKTIFSKFGWEFTP